MLDIEIKNHSFTLLTEKALFWNNSRTLILSDIHLGKSGHFRRSGIAAPQQINETNLLRLSRLIEGTNPQRILILGDLFHSSQNKEWSRFEEWRRECSRKAFHLVMGNHDFLDERSYSNAAIQCHKQFEESGFRFTHIPKEHATPGSFTFCGHIHPGVRLKGPGRQALHLPCFYQAENQMILPAFGEFTGCSLVDINGADQLYAVAESKIVSLKNKI